MLEQKHNEELNADAANSQLAYCKTDVTCIPSVAQNRETSFDLSKYGFILSRRGETGVEFYRREFDGFFVELMVSADVYSLYLFDGETEIKVANRYKVSSQEQLDFLVFNGRVGYAFNHAT